MAKLGRINQEINHTVCVCVSMNIGVRSPLSVRWCIICVLIDELVCTRLLHVLINLGSRSTLSTEQASIN